MTFCVGLWVIVTNHFYAFQLREIQRYSVCLFHSRGSGLDIIGATPILDDKNEIVIVKM